MTPIRILDDFRHVLILSELYRYYQDEENTCYWCLTQT